MLFSSVLALGNFCSLTAATYDLDRMVIREENSSEGSIGLDDPIVFDDSLSLAAVNDPGSSQNIFGTTSSVADHSDFDGALGDDGAGTLGFPPNSLIPQSGDLLAFHDGDVPPEGWGDCEFPKMPACCEYTTYEIFCVWFQEKLQICPGHPENYYFPRGPKEQDTYRPLCCDQVKDGVGVGCVPVTGREEKVGLDIEYPPDDDWLGNLFPGLEDFNNLQFNPIPGTCKSAYRRDEQIAAPCLPPK